MVVQSLVELSADDREIEGSNPMTVREWMTPFFIVRNYVIWYFCAAPHHVKFSAFANVIETRVQHLKKYPQIFFEKSQKKLSGLSGAFSTALITIVICSLDW